MFEPPQLLGAASPIWSPTNNACVSDVPAAMAALPTAGVPTSIDVGDIPSFGRFVDHAQGIARLPGDPSMFVVSRSGAGLGAVVARLDGEAGSHALAEDGELAIGEIVGRIPSPPEADHGGGIQLLGNLLVLPYEKRGEHAVVGFYDVSDPRAPKLVYELDRSEGPFPYPGNASNAAIARLTDGRLLLVVGAHSSRSLDFYVSNGLEPGTPGFAMRFFAALQRQTSTTFQNTALVTQCDGTLFLVGGWNTRLLPPSGGADKIVWLQVSNGPDGLPVFEEKGRAHMDCGRCNFAAGVGPFVTGDGSIALYAVSHSDKDGALTVEEFYAGRPPAPNAVANDPNGSR